MTSTRQDPQSSPGTAEASQRLRNARKMLAAAWDSGALTAAELMKATGLTRATVLNLARELAAGRWLREADDTRAVGEYSTGRPALRYELETSARFVAGIDAGQHRISAALADLRGTELGRREAAVNPLATAAERIQATERLLRELVASRSQKSLAALTIGVPAPVDAQGHSPQDANGFWGRMNPDWPGHLAAYSPLIRVENDANLAALAELRRDTTTSFAALLVGERLGAGTVVDGHLLRGAGGMAGEMRFLTHVQGVGNAMGLGQVARELARAALDSGTQSSLARLGRNEVAAEQVFAAAEQGDALAEEIIQALGVRLARIAAVIAGFAGLETIILSGAMAGILSPVIDIAQRVLDEEPELTRVQLTSSTLGADVVLRGAVLSAVDLVRSVAPNDR